MSRQYASTAFGGLVDVNETALRQFYSGVDRNEGATAPFVPPPPPGNKGSGGQGKDKGKGNNPGAHITWDPYGANAAIVEFKRERNWLRKRSRAVAATIAIIASQSGLQAIDDAQAGPSIVSGLHPLDHGVAA